MNRNSIWYFLHALLTVLLISPILSPISAYAAGDGDMMVISLEQALAIADSKNRDIEKAIEYRNWVEGYYIEQRSSALPNFTITSNYTRQRDESQKDYPVTIFPVEQDVFSTGIGLTQALFTWGQVGAAIRVAKIGREVAEDQLRFFRQAVARDVSQAFFDLLLAKEMAQLARENLELKERHVEEAGRKKKAGTATDYDALVAEVAYQNARPEVIRTHNLIKIAGEKLRFLLAENTKNIDVKGSLNTVIVEYPSHAEALKDALSHRPELSTLKHKYAINQELIRIHNAGDKPRIDLLGNLGWKKAYDEETNPDGIVWQAGLQVTYPIFDGQRTRGKVAQAMSDAASLRIEEAKIRDGIELEVRNAVNAMQEAGEITKALSGTVAQAVKLLDMAEIGYKLGVKTHLDVQDAQLNLLNAKSSLARAFRDYRVANATLEWVKGTKRIELTP